ncbi:MAG: hypothetical protein U1E50_19480 [Caulobacteraceae bacterium]
MPFPARVDPPPQVPDSLGVDWREGWRRQDPGLEADAKAFWVDNRLLTPGESVEQRAKQINLCAYVEGRLVGVTTASLRDTPFLRTRLAMHRVAVAPDMARHHLAHWLTVRSIEILEAWSLSHPEEKVTGVGAVIQAPLDSRRQPVWRTGLDLVGYTAQNEQFRVAWFPHARLD